MTPSDLAKEIKSAANGAVVISLSDLAPILGYKDPYRLKQKLTRDDPDSRVPVIRPIVGKKYSIKEIAIRVTEAGRRSDDD